MIDWPEDEATGWDSDLSARILMASNRDKLRESQRRFDNKNEMNE